MQRYLFATSAVLATVISLFSGSAVRAQPNADEPVKPGSISIEVGLDLLTRQVIVKVGLAKGEAPTNIDTVCPAIVPALFQQWIANVGEAVADANRQKAETAATEHAQKTRTLETRLFDQIDVRIDQVPLKQAIKNLSYASGLPIVADKKALRDAHINMDTPVTLKVQNTTVHKALTQFLGDLGLAYQLQDGAVVITTCEKASTPRLDAEQKFAAANDKIAQRIFEAGERSRRAGDYERARICFQQVHLLTPTTLHGRVAIARIIEMEERMRDATEEQGIPGRSDEEEQVFRHMRDRSIPLGLVVVSY